MQVKEPSTLCAIAPNRASEGPHEVTIQAIQTGKGATRPLPNQAPISFNERRQILGAL